MKASGAAAIASAAAMTSETRNEWVIAAAPLATDRPDTAGISASMAKLDARAIALFTPDATLTWLGSAAAMTVAVSGATKVTRPSPKTMAPGATSLSHVADASIRVR